MPTCQQCCRMRLALQANARSGAEGGTVTLLKSFGLEHSFAAIVQLRFCSGETLPCGSTELQAKALTALRYLSMLCKLLCIIP